MEIYITLCIGDWSTGTSDFIEAAGGADTDTGTECFCVSKRSFFFPQPRSSVILLPRFEKNSITTKSPRSLRATDKKHRKKKKKSNISPANVFRTFRENPKRSNESKIYIQFFKIHKVKSSGARLFYFFFPPPSFPETLTPENRPTQSFDSWNSSKRSVSPGFDPYIARGKSGKLNVGARRGEEAIISQFIPVARGSQRCTMPLPCSCVVHGGAGGGSGMRERGMGVGGSANTCSECVVWLE